MTAEQIVYLALPAAFVLLLILCLGLLALVAYVTGRTLR